MIRLGDHVIVRGEDREAVVTAVHPDAQVEVQYLNGGTGGSHRGRYAMEALEIVPAGEGDGSD